MGGQDVFSFLYFKSVEMYVTTMRDASPPISKSLIKKWNTMQCYQLFGRYTTPCMSDINVHIKLMVGILPPRASYNSRMIHKSNEAVLARHPRDSHTKSGQQQTWKKQMYVLNVFSGGWVPLCLIQKSASTWG